MADVKAKGRIAKEVTVKATEGKCLICGKDANGSRGLCVGDYLKFHRAISAKPERERPAFEEKQIQAGRILASGRLREIKNPNPFVSEAS